MVNILIHWDYHRVDDISLWYFSIKHSAWIYNEVSNHKSGLTLLEFLPKIKTDYCHFIHLYSCVFPVYVLAAKLENY